MSNSIYNNAKKYFSEENSTNRCSICDRDIKSGWYCDKRKREIVKNGVEALAIVDLVVGVVGKTSKELRRFIL